MKEREKCSPELLRSRQKSSSSTLSIANLTIQDTAAYGIPHLTAMEQMKHIVNHVKEMAISNPNNNHTQPIASSIISTTLLLRDIADFAGINTAYASLFRAGEPNPPARVTFACELPKGIDVSLSVVLSLGLRPTRRGLHVQSRSYWAPANIGPYSQAICEPLDQKPDADHIVHDAGLIEIVHVAGQIPLVPQSMNILEAPFVDQAVLSLQHLWRVGQERGVDLWPWGISFLKEESASHSRADEAWKVWQNAHSIGTKHEDDSTDEENDDDDGPDAWDLQFNRSIAFQSSQSRMTVGAHLHTLPNPNVFISPTSKTTYIPSFIAATVTALPRDARVEWWSLGLANLPKLETSKPRVEVVTGSYQWGDITAVTVQPSTTSEEESSQTNALVTHLVTVLVKSPTSKKVDANTDADADLVDIEKHLSNLLIANGEADMNIHSEFQVSHGTAFISSEGSSEGERRWMQVASKTLLAAVTVVPCTSLFGRPAIKMRKESSEFSNSTKKTGRSPSESTGGGCQPLSLAMAFRLERRVDMDA